MEAQQLILEKAFDLFKRYGIRSVSMDDIASQCGMSKKTLYQHFDDKDTLVHIILVHMVSKSESQCCTIEQKSENAVHEIFLSIDMLQEMFEGINPIMLFDLHKYHQMAYKKLNDHKQQFIYSITKKNIERGIAEGVFRADINVEIMTHLHLHTISMTFEQEMLPRQKYSLVDIQMEVMLHYVHGLATPKGVKLIEKYKQQRAAALQPA
ncbi:MAG: TetR/AcrR family transcriptional regulator [Bacteroidetes bacterium]|uniref:TetR/AcrR family transcriptional regulator n=1 Tax=Phnomibacter sp. TaxID=2836217 RepID=UPI002FDDA12F|nr:TetR/AcrR family transcriptional regulator [Bacteroidota bacterium]